MLKLFFSMTAFVFLASNAHAEVQAMLTDGQIIQLMLTADQSQIDAGLAARDQSSNSDISDYSEDSILAFTTNMNEVNKLQISNGLKLEDSEANKALKDETDKSLQDLKSQKGVTFDKSYVDGQVEMLQKFVEAMDLSLIPQAKKVDLKKFLQESRKALEQQLNNAKALQAGLVKASPRR
ncbi:MAG: DUF4142 domain-containing protein [Bdellovibrionales bacterium]|nr:DUF4142 domain-containing protein [Bdellovibrionales bacterium]